MNEVERAEMSLAGGCSVEGASFNPSANLAARFLLVAVVLGVAACEDKAIGRVCEVQADGGSDQSLINGQALECPSRICLRPAPDGTLAQSVDTTALCTAECSKDSDCDGAETRVASNNRDKRCRTGFVCGVATSTGSVACCKKLCLCKDFLVIPPSGLEVPVVCDPIKNPGLCPLRGR
jgi:hypothetical protein